MHNTDLDHSHFQRPSGYCPTNANDPVGNFAVLRLRIYFRERSLLLATNYSYLFSALDWLVCKSPIINKFG